MVKAVIAYQNLIILLGVSMEGGVKCHHRLMKILIDDLRISHNASGMGANIWVLVT